MKKPAYWILFTALCILMLALFHGCGNVTGGGGGGGIITYTLGISVTPEGWGTVEVFPTSEVTTQEIIYASGTIVTVTAEPTSGHVFDHWGGDLTGFGSIETATITMDVDKDITASFQHIYYTLSVSVTPDGSGTIEPWGGSFIDSTNVVLTAEAGTGYNFDHWSGDLTGSNTTETIAMSGNKNVTAEFAAVAVPTLTTTAVTSITANSASSGGNITNDGGAAVTARGVCWNTSGSPTIADSKTTDGSGTGSFTSSITGLTAGTTYEVRAYATNSAGTAYGSEESFTTPLHSIGESYGGGIIIYIDGTGLHGLIAATSETTVPIEWGGSGTTTNAIGTAIGSGEANTNTIVGILGAGSYAAKICYDLNLNGYSDWFLPSKDELHLLYLYKDLVGGIVYYTYWSSSEDSSTNACAENLGSGTPWTPVKTYTARVRAIRAF